MIYHHQFLIHGLVFPQTNITMKPSYTQGNLMKLFYKTDRHEKYSITVTAVESWNKIQKQLKCVLLKDLSPNKINSCH